MWIADGKLCCGGLAFIHWRLILSLGCMLKCLEMGTTKKKSECSGVRTIAHVEFTVSLSILIGSMCSHSDSTSI